MNKYELTVVLNVKLEDEEYIIVKQDDILAVVK